MFISMNWIRDFVDLSGLDTDDLIHRFSLSTAEVENEIFYRGKDISGIVVAEILSVEPHPQSKKLHLLKVDAGDGKETDVVCGAPNVRVGMKTAFAKIGARVGEIDIAPRALAGYTSFGMCCSEKELGMSDDNSGILDLDPTLKNGTDIKDVFAIDDVIFEVDNKSLTNRPDLWGHYGIAREFAALANRPLKPLEVADLNAYAALPKIDLAIEDPLCYRYSCLQFENITRHISPANMRIRLYYCGMRAINFLADLTNYLMLEMGQPMHAFDSRKVEKIRVRRFPAPFTFQTLDGVERAIDENTLMICNGDKPVAIAGIMGGLDSEIVADTSSLTLESATFDAVSVRKSSARLSHRTDASMRYEKSLDPEMTVKAIARFVKLLSDSDAGVKVTSSLTDEYRKHFDTVKLDFDRKFVDRYTGIDIDEGTIVKTLTALGFDVAVKDGSFHVVVPSWRATKDVTLKADIIEEITRIYGYDNFDIHTAKAPLYPIRAFAEKSMDERTKDLLVKSFGLHEVHSYIWEYYDEYKKLGIETETNVKLLGAVNPNIETLRRSMIPNQLCQVRVNASYAPTFGIFEIGRIVDGVDEAGLCREHKKLAISLFSRVEEPEALYRRLVNILSTLSADLKHRDLTFEKIAPSVNYVHPKNNNRIFCGDLAIGEIGMVHPLVASKIDKKAKIVFAEIDMKDFTAVPDLGIHYQVASKFPSIEVDLSFLTETFAPIASALKVLNSPLIKKVSLLGTYADDKGKTVTVRIVFSHPDRTLTKDEVMAIVDELVKLSGVELKA